MNIPHVQELPGTLELGPVTESILVHGLRILLVIVLAIVVYRVFFVLARRIARRVQDADGLEDSAADKRVETLFGLVTNAGLVAVVSVALVMILVELGLDVRPLLASVGVVGLALGLGAQTLVQDVISGIFIFIENQYTVGDIVTINDQSGTVEEVTLRVSKVRDLDGVLHIIPNGEIRTVSNKTRGWSRALVDVGITYEDSVDEAEGVLLEIGQSALSEPEIGPLLMEEPTITGIEGLEDWQIRLRLMVKTLPGEQFAVERYLRDQIQRIFPKRGLSLASPRQEVVLIRE